MIKKIFASVAALGMVIVPFNNSILAGTTLVRDAMKSENYVAGTAGWQISRNGDAEFNNLVARGSFISGDGTGKHIAIDGSTGLIEFYTGDPEEAAPGSIQAQVNTPDPMAVLSMLLTSPESSAPTQVATISLSSQGGNANGSNIFFSAETIGVTDAIEISTSETWHNITLLNSWATLNSLTPQYRKDFAGNVELIGRLSGGTTGVIGALPSGYRPKQVLDFALKCNGDASSMCWLQINTSGTITVVGNVAAAQTWLSLVLSFSAKA
jgi:hypothetical protein